MSKASRVVASVKQQSGQTYWKWVKLAKEYLFLQVGVMMHYEKYMGHNVTQLVVPKHRRSQVLEMGHDMAGHAS